MFGLGPFGGNSESGFSGSFNGQGYEITGLVINDITDSEVGFLGEMSGPVENVKIEDSVTRSGFTNGGFVGRV